MPFPARFKGTCETCKGEIIPGQFITWSRREKGKAYHVDCANPNAKPPATPSAGPSSEELMSAMSKMLAEAMSKLAAPVAAPVAEDEPTEEEMAKTRLSPSTDLPDLAHKASALATSTPKRVPSATPSLNENSPWWEMLSAALPVCNRILIVGPKSTGKSTTALLATKAEYRITMTERMTVEDALGMYLLKDGETVWVDAPIAKAMREGKPVLIDEADRRSPEIESLFYGIIDDKPHASLSNGEVLYAKEGFKVIMTSNEAPSTFPEPVQDRIQCVLFAQTPHPDATKSLSKAEQLLIERTYAKKSKPRVVFEPTPRKQNTVAALRTAGIPASVAMKMVYCDAATEIESALASIAAGLEAK